MRKILRCFFFFYFCFNNILPIICAKGRLFVFFFVYTTLPSSVVANINKRWNTVYLYLVVICCQCVPTYIDLLCVSVYNFIWWFTMFRAILINFKCFCRNCKIAGSTMIERNGKTFFFFLSELKLKCSLCCIVIC